MHTCMQTICILMLVFGIQGGISSECGSFEQSWLMSVGERERESIHGHSDEFELISSPLEHFLTA